MARAIMLREFGGPEALRIEDVTVGKPASGQLRIRQTAIGVNFHDIYVRTGLYKTLALPGIPGIEAVGVVDAIGPAVSHFQVGDRVGYVSAEYGAYASQRLLPANLAIRLPADIDDRTAASVLVRGLTVEVLTTAAHVVRPGDWVLVHAAAGGVGRLLCQKLKDIGAFVIGTVGSEEKAAVARAMGCDEVILYRSEDFVARVKGITNGRGCEVVYDSVGKDTFMGSLECLAMRGHLVNFGQASGPVPPFAVSALAARSTSVSRPIVFHYLTDPAERYQMATSLFGALSRGALTVGKCKTMKLAEAGAAQSLLESRTMTESIVLVP